jgi:hypothetical protein
MVEKKRGSNAGSWAKMPLKDATSGGGPGFISTSAAHRTLRRTHHRTRRTPHTP